MDVRQCIFDALLHESNQLREEIRLLQGVQRRMVFSVVGIVGASVPIVTLLLNFESFSGGRELYLAILFGCLSTIVLIFMGIYLSFYFSISRISEYLNSKISTDINILIGSTSEIHVLMWENWLREEYRDSIVGKLIVTSSAVAEFGCMMFIFLISEAVWVTIALDLAQFQRFFALIMVFHAFFLISACLVSVAVIRKASEVRQLKEC